MCQKNSKEKRSAKEEKGFSAEEREKSLNQMIELALNSIIKV